MSRIDHPEHYNQGEHEVIDVIHDWQLGFDLGNVIKYVARAGKKDADTYLEDLEKAKWYLEHEINRYKEANKRNIIRKLNTYKSNWEDAHGE